MSRRWTSGNVIHCASRLWDVVLPVLILKLKSTESIEECAIKVDGLANQIRELGVEMQDSYDVICKANASTLNDSSRVFL
jgi:hypothetical protein